MIYRDRKTIYYPRMTPGENSTLTHDGTFQAETFSSINAAKREVRAKRLEVRRGKPPAASELNSN